MACPGILAFHHQNVVISALNNPQDDIPNMCMTHDWEVFIKIEMYK